MKIQVSLTSANIGSSLALEIGMQPKTNEISY